MTVSDKQVLTDVVQLIQMLAVKIDALERALARRGLLHDSHHPALSDEYLGAALTDLAAVRTLIASLPSPEF